MRTRLATPLAVAASLVVALALSELLARGLEWLRAPGTAQVAQSGEFVSYDETLGWRLAPGAKGRIASAEFDTAFAIDAHGARMAREVPYARDPLRKRVLLLGDSFTFGYGVQDAQRFGDLLAARLPGVEIVNLGVLATGTDQQWLLYQREGVKYGADLVVLGYMTDHIVRNARTSLVVGGGKVVSKPAFALEGGLLELRNVPVPREGPLVTFSALARLVGRARAAGARSLAAPGTDPYPQYDAGSPEWALTTALVRGVAESVRASGSELLLLSIPVREYVVDPAVEPRGSAAIAEFANAEGLALLDFLPALRAAAQAGEQPYFEQDPHWTPAGHAVAAEILYARLARRFASRAGIRARLQTRISMSPIVSSVPRLERPG